jgi:HAD superfamily hydrolase (TIGR01509 family)
MHSASFRPLVIFDCDGVLVDSEPLANRVLADLLTELGRPTTTEESLRRYVGRSLASILDEVESELGGPLAREREDVVEQYRSGVFAGFARGLLPVAGIAEALQQIARSDVAICVASSSQPDRIELSLRLTGLLPHFEGCVFSAVEVERGKPHPDLFLHAARQMGAEPDQCLVVEDSVYGVRAGVAAGMPVLGYCPDGPAADPARLAAAGARLFGAMAELPGLVSGSLAALPGAGVSRSDR